MKLITCPTCGDRTLHYARGVCQSCYRDPVVREALPPGKGRPPEFKEPTMAEVEALIAEQMKCLPPWWDLETRRMAERGTISKLYA